MPKKRRSTQPAPSAADVTAEALARYRSLLDEEEFAQLLAELERPLYTAIRINPLKVDPQPALQEWVERYNWEVQPVPYCPNGFWITSARVSPSQTIEHRLGFYYIQDAASMLPVELFDFEGTEAPLMLDMAASPGGKTTHLIDRSGDQGLVIANDSSPSRINALRLVLEQWGAVSPAVTRFPGESFGNWFPETFDRVLLDAPCSMQNLRSTESHPMRPISDKERSTLALRQANLLESALAAVKTGGEVVYSTCTLAPEEDEAVLDTVIRRHPGLIEVVDLSDRLPGPAPALTGDGMQQFHPSVQRAARLWPHRFGTSGFFAALLTKTGSLPEISSAPPARPFERAGFDILNERETDPVSRELLDRYGFDLIALLKERDWILLRRGRSLSAVPGLYLQRFRDLPVQALGLPLGEELPDAVIPSHEWVARFSQRFSTGRYRLPQEHLQAWLRGEDIRIVPEGDMASGQVVIIEDSQGRLLGRGRLLADRIKNLLPRGIAAGGWRLGT
jgi:16S rRNA (cytosine1407-C5)-methyltransferase